MKKIALSIITILFGLSTISHAKSPYFNIEDHSLKRFSISAGWLHASPQGSPNPVKMSTHAKGTNYKNQSLRTSTIPNYIARTPEGNAARTRYDSLLTAINEPYSFLTIPNNTFTPNLSGITQINSLENWSNPKSGFKAQDLDALGIMMNYHISDNISIGLKLNSPSNLKLNGVGKLNAPIQGFTLLQGRTQGENSATDNNAVNAVRAIPLDGRIPITNLEQSKTAASMRAWLPAIEVQYQFGQAGITAFRPYIGVGVMYAHFSHMKLDKGIEKDLINTGHFVQNLLDQNAGAALEGRKSSADPKVKIQTKNAFAPILTIGATYDFDSNWFAVASVSYAKLHTTAEILIRDNNTYKTLGRAKSKINIDPFMTYVGVGYRF